jgi:hypothetical protein
VQRSPPLPLNRAEVLERRPALAHSPPDVIQITAQIGTCDLLGARQNHVHRWRALLSRKLQHLDGLARLQVPADRTLVRRLTPWRDQLAGGHVEQPPLERTAQATAQTVSKRGVWDNSLLVVKARVRQALPPGDDAGRALDVYVHCAGEC